MKINVLVIIFLFKELESDEVKKVDEYGRVGQQFSIFLGRFEYIY